MTQVPQQYTDPVVQYYGDLLEKENGFLACVDQKLGELQLFLEDEGRPNDPKFQLLKTAYDEAVAQAGKMYKGLQQMIQGIHQPMPPKLEEKLPPIGHASRQSALYLEGCKFCRIFSPELYFFHTLNRLQIQQFDHMLNLLKSGQLDSEAIWNDSQSLLLLDSVIPRELKDPEEQQSKSRKQMMALPFAFAAGKMMGDDGIDFVKDIAAEVGLI